MLDIWRVKKTKEIVYPISQAGKPGYINCLFTFDHKSKKGNLADVRPVKESNISKDRESVMGK
jgi:hypothetical protein